MCNTPTDKEHEKDVDMVQPIAVTEVFLKPLLSYSANDGCSGELLPGMFGFGQMYPTQIAGYAPRISAEVQCVPLRQTRALQSRYNIPARSDCCNLLWAGKDLGPIGFIQF